VHTCSGSNDQKWAKEKRGKVAKGSHKATSFGEKRREGVAKSAGGRFPPMAKGVPGGGERPQGEIKLSAGKGRVTGCL